MSDGTLRCDVSDTEPRITTFGAGRGATGWDTCRVTVNRGSGVAFSMQCGADSAAPCVVTP